MSFSEQIDKLQQQITKLGALMDEAEALEAQKLAVLGFDQENVLESEINYRFTEQVQLIQQEYAAIIEQYPTELAQYSPENNDDSISLALEGFRKGEAELAHIWDLFGE